MRFRCLVVATFGAIVSSAHGMLTDEEKTKLLDSARQFTEKAQGLLRERTFAGIDRRPEDFREVDPAIFEGSPSEAQHISRLSQMINFIDFKIRNDSVNTTVTELLSSTKSNGSPPLYCPFQPPTECALTKYRTLNGTCNNLRHPLRGAALTPLARDLRPVYENGNAGDEAFNLPRSRGRNRALPSARAVSRTVHQGTPNQMNHNVSVFFTFWGQFLAHMITDRALGAGFNGSKVNCCSQSKPTPRGECFNIAVPKNDPFRKLGTTCLGFLRSLEVTDVNCQGGRQQLNVASSYIDGSAVYGVEKERAEFLRTHIGGLMAVSEPNQLPYRKHVNAIAAKSGFSFVTAGDPRAAEVAPLTGVHTIWVREHNRIARGLAKINPQWDDETLYQETRRIIVAMIQHVTYREWLPLLLGSKLYRRYRLQPQRKGFFTGYSPAVDASTSNVIATAAFRFGHSLVPAVFPLCDKRYQPTSPAVSIVDVFYRPNVYLMKEQSLMRCLLARRAPAMDASLSTPLTSQLFQINQPHGADLAALNIQRGRDHGIPSYNAWRRSLRLTPSTRFVSGKGGFRDIPEDTVRRLRRIYSHPEDVDLWTGGVSETPLGGAVLGPLFGNLLARQFLRYKRGDRFWYETSLKPQAFTAEQLKQIRGTRFARVVCNTYDVDFIQTSAFRVPRASRNARVGCNRLPQIDLRLWKS